MKKVTVPNIFNAIRKTPKGNLQLEIFRHGLFGLVVPFDQFEGDMSSNGLRG